MNFDPVLFRKQFPEFSDPAKFPDEMLLMYWDVATAFIGTSSCPCGSLTGKQRQVALNLMTAHLLALSTQADGTGTGGSGAASGGGFELSATIGEISVTNMAPPVKDGWQYWLSQSPYGQQLWALTSLLAVGGLAIGGLPERIGFRKIGGVFL